MTLLCDLFKLLAAYTKTKIYVLECKKEKKFNKFKLLLRSLTSEACPKHRTAYLGEVLRPHGCPAFSLRLLPPLFVAPPSLCYV